MRNYAVLNIKWSLWRVYLLKSNHDLCCPFLSTVPFVLAQASKVLSANLNAYRFVYFRFFGSFLPEFWRFSRNKVNIFFLGSREVCQFFRSLARMTLPDHLRVLLIFHDSLSRQIKIPINVCGAVLGCKLGQAKVVQIVVLVRIHVQEASNVGLPIFVFGYHAFDYAVDNLMWIPSQHLSQGVLLHVAHIPRMLSIHVVVALFARNSQICRIYDNDAISVASIPHIIRSVLASNVVGRQNTHTSERELLSIKHMIGDSFYLHGVVGRAGHHLGTFTNKGIIEKLVGDCAESQSHIWIEWDSGGDFFGDERVLLNQVELLLELVGDAIISNVFTEGRKLEFLLRLDHFGSRFFLEWGFSDLVSSNGRIFRVRVQLIVFKVWGVGFGKRTEGVAIERDGLVVV